jgi:hypothetical protein
MESVTALEVLWVPQLASWLGFRECTQHHVSALGILVTCLDFLYETYLRRSVYCNSSFSIPGGVEDWRRVP